MGTGNDRPYGPWIRAAAISLLTLIAAAPAAAQPYGLTAPEPVGAYLNGTFPTRAPGTGGTWDVQNAFPNLTFRDPLQLLEIPGQNKFIIIGKAGEVWVFDNDPATTTKTLVLDIVDEVLQQADGGLLGIALHPEFDQTGSSGERTLFLFYRYTPEPGHSANNAYVRLSRYTINAAMDQVDPASELVMIQQYDRHGWHNGGGMFFGPDGFLYLTSGDEGGSNDQYGSGQKMDLGLFGGVLRIDVDQDPTRSHPTRRQPQNPATPPDGWPDTFSQGYFIPNDNPWLDPGGSILEEFWAIGLRSPHRMTYDPVTETAWIGDVGQGSREEISVAFAGANLQWPYREGSIDGPKQMPNPLIGIDQPPIHDYPRSTGVCVIGGFVYRGAKWAVDLEGKYLFGDHGVRNVWTLTPGSGAPQIDFMLNVPPSGVGSKNGISSFATDAVGEVYILKLFGTDLDGGVIYKLIQNNPIPDPPTWLSELGAFDDLTSLDPADGFVPYDVESPLWSDAAAKTRWIALPNDGTHNSVDERITMLPYGDWKFPPGTVFVKHFELPLDANDPQQKARLETRFLVVDEDDEVYGLTYRWNAGGTDAQLLTTTESAMFTVYDEGGSPSPQTWTFPSRADCNTCHNANAGRIRGVNTHQLNAELTYPDSGVTDNQLRAWNHLGMLRPAVREADIGALPSAVPVDYPSYDRARRVRSYLDANCAQCHRPNGADSLFDARLNIPLELQNLVNGPVVGDYGVPDAATIKPQSLGSSILLQRISSLADDRMPPLASSVAHAEAIELVTEWILELTDTTPLCDNVVLSLPQTDWTLLYADSEENGTPATNAIDGDPDTFWHTEWDGSDPPHPHELQIDLGAHYDLIGLTYLPRQTGSLNGTVSDMTVYVSDDPGNWGSSVGSGTFPTDQLESRLTFEASGRYVRFVADSEINGNQWTSMAELNVLKRPCQIGCTAPAQVVDLVLSKVSGDAVLDWTGAGGGVEFDVLRSGDPGDFLVPECIETRDLDGEAIDSDDPLSNEVFYYLVRGVDGCSGDTVSAGVNSSGESRLTGLCPM